MPITAAATCPGSSVASGSSSGSLVRSAMKVLSSPGPHLFDTVEGRGSTFSFTLRAANGAPGVEPHHTH